ncbi:hypothetical protein HDU76_006471 [Blyttiomyces sp. JEL0837]|nr:hypothetical protein HDU76_006471 [Blyttiomyces sp. JEL0837]
MSRLLSPSPSMSSSISPSPTPSSSYPNVSRTTSLGAENCVVTVRIRPLTPQEIDARQQSIWEADEVQGKVIMQREFADSNRKINSEFNYDIVQAGSDNKNLYERAAQNVVWAAMEGMNGTVFAYGQTASGKTYSMMGVDEQPGIIPQAIDDVFSYIREQTEDREYLLRVSYLEIYNEQIRDLLNPDQKDLRIHEDRKRGVYVSPLKEEIVTTPKQVMKVIQKGELNRHFGSTDYNEHSSRSHTIFQMVIESRDRNSGVMSPPAIKRSGITSAGKLRGSVTISQLNLIDLAGSEKATSDAERRKEGAHINRSLLTLGNVISKLTEDRNSQHIPYRDSKLTRILQSSLSGNARVSLIATISPSIANLDETSNTLKFAERVKKVPVRAHQNQVLDEKALIQKYKLEIAELRNKLVETNDLLEKERALQEENLERAIRQQYEEQLHESQLVRTALKERIDHLTKLILSSKSVTPKAILDWNAPAETGDKRASVIIDGLLPQVPGNEGTPQDISRMSRIGRKSMRLSRQLSDKDFVRKQIAEIDKRDEQIHRLELLISQLKASKDRGVQAAISSFFSDPEKAVKSTEELLAENHRLHREKEEMDIVITEQNEKLEMLEAQGVVPGAGGVTVKFEESPKYKEMSFVISQQRTALEDRDSLIKALKTQIQELRAQVKNLELNEFEHLEQLAAAGLGGKNSKRSSLNSESIAARVRELEAALEREKALRQEEQNKHAEAVAQLEAELTIFFHEDTIRYVKPGNPSNVPSSVVRSGPTDETYESIGLVTKTYWDDQSDIDEDEYDDDFDEQSTAEKVPEGHVSISLMDGSANHIVPETLIELVDRAMVHGDLVRMKSQPPTSQSGIVIRSRLIMDIKHVISGKVIESVDCVDLKYALDIEEGLIVGYRDWVGQVEELWDQVAIIFEDGSVCFPKDQNELEPADNLDDNSHFAMARFYPGQPVRAQTKSTLTNGVWLKGGYNPAMNDKGTVLSVRAVKAKVHWTLYNSLKDSENCEVEPPPETLDVACLKVLGSVFDSCSYQIGDKVVFSDPGVAKRYIESIAQANDQAAPHLCTFVIVKTCTFVDVEWQDGSLSENIRSTDLVPCMHLDDQDAWPGDYVTLKNETTESDMVGLVLSVNASDRTAKVRWFDSQVEQLEGAEEEYSLYEIVIHNDMQYRVSERVVVMVDSDGTYKSRSIEDWFAEVLSIRKDGLVELRFFHSGKTANLSPRRLLVVSTTYNDLDGDYEDEEEEDEDEGDYVDDESEEFMDLVLEPTKSRTRVDKAGVPDDEDDEWVTDDEAGSFEDEEIPQNGVNPVDANVPIPSPLKEEIAAGTPANMELDLKSISLVTSDSSWKTFDTCEQTPPSHYYYSSGTTSYSRKFHQRLKSEYAILNKSLPLGILVRVFEDRIDLMRVLMVGPEGTPYDKGLFLFDVSIPAEYPQAPPLVYFHSWTFGMGRLNPNLYEGESLSVAARYLAWESFGNVEPPFKHPAGLVLNRNPYYNEAGYERQIGTEEGAVNSALYSERTYLLVLRSCQHVLTNPPEPFENEVQEHFFKRGELSKIIERAQHIQKVSEQARGQQAASSLLVNGGDNDVDFPIHKVSGGGLKLLKNYCQALAEIAEKRQ